MRAGLRRGMLSRSAVRHVHRVTGERRARADGTSAGRRGDGETGRRRDGETGRRGDGGTGDGETDGGGLTGRRAVRPKGRSDGETGRRGDEATRPREGGVEREWEGGKEGHRRERGKDEGTMEEEGVRWCDGGMRRKFGRVPPKVHLI